MNQGVNDDSGVFAEALVWGPLGERGYHSIVTS